MPGTSQIELKEHCLQLSEKMLDCAGDATREAGKASSRNCQLKEQYHLGKRDAFLHLYQLLKELPREAAASSETQAGRRRSIRE